MECYNCPDAVEGSLLYGVKGVNADSTKIMMVLHRADSRVLQPTIFGDDYLTALGSAYTGKVIGRILQRAALSLDDVYVTNIFKCLLPGDREPGEQEYRNCGVVFERQLAEFYPKKLVLFGKMPFIVATRQGKDNGLEAVVHDIIDVWGVQALVMYHPSKLIGISSAQREKYYDAAMRYLMA